MRRLHFGGVLETSVSREWANMKVFNFFKKKRPGAKPAPIKRETRSGWPEPAPPMAKKKIKSLKTLGWGRFFRRVRFPRWRIPWWLRLIKWREIPGWGKFLIVLGAVGIGLAIWFAVQSSLAPPPEYRLSVTTEPAGGGQVSLSPSYDDYSKGTQVSLTVTPSAEYEFVSWSGDASGESPTVTVIMDSDKEVTANFRVIQYALTAAVSPPEGGRVSPSSGTYDSGDSVSLTAAPSAEYEFVSWSGDASGESPTVTVTMDSDKEVTANFVATFQEIRFIMPTGISGSAVVYTNVLERGEIIEGFVELTGEYRAQDWSFDWTFEIIGPEGRKIDYWEGHWVKDNHHDFSFKAQYNGTYRIRVRHNSLDDKDLLIRIKPKGWS
jgi:hypothetical protein